MLNLEKEHLKALERQVLDSGCVGNLSDALAGYCHIGKAHLPPGGLHFGEQGLRCTRFGVPAATNQQVDAPFKLRTCLSSLKSASSSRSSLVRDKVPRSTSAQLYQQSVDSENQMSVGRRVGPIGCCVSRKRKSSPHGPGQRWVLSRPWSSQRKDSFDEQAHLFCAADL
jgi:hypothetical protein